MNALIRDNLATIADLCREHRVKRLFLVGSALGDRFDPATSDVDFIVVFEDFERLGWDDPYFKLLEALQTLFGRPVDLIEAKTLRNPYLIAELNDTKKLLYAA